ncbi:hypothetical protein [Xanthomonas theicola]|uniref:hypothetical protein n=1 Tax=Xanthomonas theicola TaxID=56464 RepID=UPI001304E81C|nr:hypothetical protein [Xanthomonas theicola]
MTVRERFYDGAGKILAAISANRRPVEYEYEISALRTVYRPKFCDGSLIYLR